MTGFLICPRSLRGECSLDINSTIFGYIHAFIDIKTTVMVNNKILDCHLGIIKDVQYTPSLGFTAIRIHPANMDIGIEIIEITSESLGPVFILVKVEILVNACGRAIFVIARYIGIEDQRTHYIIRLNLCLLPQTH